LGAPPNCRAKPSRRPPSLTLARHAPLPTARRLQPKLAALHLRDPWRPAQP
jgi:hypothetical protein